MTEKMMQMIQELEQLRSEGRFEEARPLAEQVSGKIELAEQRLAEIRSAYEEAMRPKTGPAWYACGKEHAAAGREAEAMQAWQQGAALGDAACTAQAALRGMQTRRYEIAFEYAQQGAQQGHALCMGILSDCLQRGLGTEPNETESFIWAQKAAEGGNKLMFYPLALKYARAEGTERSASMAMQWAQRAAQEGMPHREEACKLLEQLEEARRQAQARQEAERQQALAREEEEKRKREEQTREENQRSMQQEALREYQQGLEQMRAGQAQSGFALLLSAAEKGCPGAMLHTAICYADAAGTGRVWKQASNWAELAAHQALPEQARQNLEAVRSRIRVGRCVLPEADYASVLAAYQQGVLYYKKQMYPEALRLFEQAGRAGYAYALESIGLMYLGGLGLPRSSSCALQFLIAAAERGSHNALQIIARSFVGGTKAPAVIGLAARLGSPAARQAWERLIEKERASGPIQCASGAWATAQGARLYHQKEYAQSWAWFMKGARMGDLDALCALGMMEEAGVYEKAAGGKKAAQQWYQLAGFCGHSYGMYRAAQYYEPAEPEVARQAFALAARWGYAPDRDR